MKKTVISLIVAILLLGGCTTGNTPVYSGKSFNRIKTYETGRVIDVKPVIISDDGMGTFLGALIGTVFGSTMGRGRGTALTTLAGGLAGAYAGSQINRANALELSVVLDNGRKIIVLVKGINYHVGDHIKIVKEGNRVDQVYKID